MDYNSLVYNQNEIKIKIKELNECLKEKLDVRDIAAKRDKIKPKAELNYKYGKALLEEIIRRYNQDLYLWIKNNIDLKDMLSDYSTYGDVIITQNGMFFDLTPIKNIFLDQYGFPNSEHVLKTIYDMINVDNLPKLKILFPKVIDAYNNYCAQYQKKHYKEYRETSNKEKIRQLVNESFCEKMKEDIKKVLTLYENEELSRVNDENVSETKLHHVLAKKVAFRYDKLSRLLTTNRYNNVEEKESIERKLLSCYKYLEDYTNKYHSISAKKIKRTLKVKTNDRVEEVKHSAQALPTLKEKKSLIREKYNYNFFDFETVNKKELFSRIREASSNYPNSDELKEILERKIKLYESLNYIGVKIGANSFDGYIGFELSNGYVVLDSLFEDFKTGKISYGNAIYIVKKKDFNTITTMSKTDAIEFIKDGKIEAERIIHKEGYESKVYKYVNKND